jgi:hypothetical protein
MKQLNLREEGRRPCSHWIHSALAVDKLPAASKALIEKIIVCNGC